MLVLWTPTLIMTTMTARPHDTKKTREQKTRDSCIPILNMLAVMVLLVGITTFPPLRFYSYSSMKKVSPQQQQQQQRQFILTKKKWIIFHFLLTSHYSYGEMALGVVEIEKTHKWWTHALHTQGNRQASRFMNYCEHSTVSSVVLINIRAGRVWRKSERRRLQRSNTSALPRGNCCMSNKNAANVDYNSNNSEVWEDDKLFTQHGKIENSYAEHIVERFENIFRSLNSFRAHFTLVSFLIY